MSDSWIILRVSGRHTLKLAQTLAEDGFDVWTPAEVRKIRIPRANVRRDVTLPIMPSYVFARSRHLVDLIQMSAQPFKPRRKANQPAHADFSVMRFHDSIPTVADGHLQALRVLEAKRQPRKKAQRLPKGMEVRVKTEGGSFAGMQGKVERSDEQTTLVCFDSRMTVKIATSLLSLDAVRNELPSSGVLSRKAA